MRITYIGFLLGHGGDAMQMLDLAVGAQAAGASVVIIVPAVESTKDFADRCAARGITCERSSLITADMDGSRQKLLPLLRLLRSHRSELVHFHTGDFCLPRLVLVAMVLLRFPKAVVTVHSPESTPRDARRASFWARQAGRRFAAVVSPSQRARDFQLQLGVSAEVCQVIYNCVDVERFASGDATAAHLQLGVPPTTPLIVFSSRLDAQKRPLDALKILQSLGPEHRDAMLVFVGSGRLAERVRDDAVAMGLADRVKLVGYQRRVEDWLAGATAWVFPTSSENFSIALLEALAAGCAIVATFCPGNDEVLVDDVNACTFEVGDIETATNRLGRILSDARYRSQLSAGAHATAARFALQTMVDEYLAVYVNVSGEVPEPASASVSSPKAAR